MIIDYQNLFSDDQAITTTAVSTNIIDLGANASEIQANFEKGMAKIAAQVTEAFAGGTSVQVTVQTDDNTGFSSAKTLYETAAIVTASLVQGYQFPLDGIPLGVERYIRLNYTVVGTYTAGKIHAGIVVDKQSNGL